MSWTTALKLSFREGSQAFISTWSSKTAPNPFGKKIFTGKTLDRFINPWQGYHVTQLERIEKQLEKGEFEKNNKPIYWYPFLRKGTLKSPLNYIQKQQEGETPVILWIGSRSTPEIDAIDFYPRFPKGRNQKVKILDVWEINQTWIKSYYKGESYPTLKDKLSLSWDAGKSSFRKEWKKIR